MEDHQSKTIHPDPANFTTTTLEPPNSPPADDPPPPPPPVTAGEPKNKSQEEDPEPGCRESKRRKLCPSALEKCEAIIVNSCSNSSNCFSFSFDPKFSFGVSTPQVTPKFGSFNLVPDPEATVSAEEIEVKSGKEGGGKEEEDGVEEKRNLLEILGSGDEGISAEDYLEQGSDSDVFL